MPINTSMNRWSSIASNMDIESASSSSPFDSFNKPSAERSRQGTKSQDTNKPDKSTSRRTTGAGL